MASVLTYCSIAVEKIFIKNTFIVYKTIYGHQRKVYSDIIGSEQTSDVSENTLQSED